jgi:hypothetical protein
MSQQEINVGTTANDRKGDSLRAAFQKVNANFTELYTSLGLNDNSLNLGAFEFTGSVMNTTDSSGITIDQAVTVTSDLTVGGDIVPAVAQGGDLGSPAKPWRSLYVSGSTIYIGDVPVTVDGQGNLLVGGSAVADVGTAAWDNITGKPTFAAVATSGSYADLSNRPSIPADINDLTDTGNLLFDGNYNSLTNKPDLAGSLTFPDATVQTTAYTGYHTGDVTGSVFADDSTLLVDAVSGTIPGILTGDWYDPQGSFNISAAAFGVIINRSNLSVGSGYASLLTDDIRLQGSEIVTIESSSSIEFISPSITLTGDIRSEGNINIDIGGIYSTLRRWTFGEDGDLTFASGGSLNLQGSPIANAGTISFGGSLQSEGDVTIDVNLTDSTLRRWTFGEDGELTLPNSQQIRATDANILEIGTDLAKLQLNEFKQSAFLMAKKSFSRSFSGVTEVDGGFSYDPEHTFAVTDDSQITVTFVQNQGMLLLRLLDRLETKLGGSEDFPWDYTNIRIVINEETENELVANIDTVLRADNNYGNIPIEFEINIDEDLTAYSAPIETIRILYDYNNTVGFDVDEDRFGMSTDYDDIDIYSGRDIDLIANDDITLRANSVLDIHLVRNDGQDDDNGILLITRDEDYTNENIWTFQFDGETRLPGGIIMSGDIESDGQLSIRLSGEDSSEKTWYFGNDGELTFPDGTNQSTAFTGNAATIDITDTNGIDTNYYLTFVENKDGGEILRADSDLIFNSADNTLTAGNITTGVLKIDDGVHEKFQALADATGVVTHDCDQGSIFYHTSPDANWTVNLTNLNLDNNYSTNVAIVVEQGGTPYYPNALQIGGVAQTIKWFANVTPIPQANKTEIATFTIFRKGDGSYNVLGSYSSYG